MKKKLLVMMMGLCLMFAFTGCGHEHSYRWNGDMTSHWQVCADCGEETEKEEHVMNEYGECEGCGGIVYNNDDGTSSVLMYDESGAVYLQAEYDADGQLYFYHREDNVYDENGSIQSGKTYEYDYLYDEEGTERLVDESTYLPCENPDHGDIYLAESISYDIDGGKIVSEYNELSYITKYTIYDAEGNVVSEEVHELEFNDDEICTAERAYINGVLDTEYLYEVNEDGEITLTTYIYYDANGEVLETYKYDAEGNEIE